MRLRYEYATVCENHAEGYQAQHRGLRGCNLALENTIFVPLMIYLMTHSVPQTMTKIAGQCTGTIWKETAIL